MGVEAKVDESFGSETVCERYQDALETLSSNPRSKAAERVTDLLSWYFADTNGPCESRFAGVGYQLLTATAGTVSTPADIALFYVAVFRTREFDEETGRANRLDYGNFIKLAGGECLMEDDEGCLAHELGLDARRLVCI